MENTKRKRGRPVGTTQKRLYDIEQVRDEQKTYGFTAGFSTYEPLNTLSLSQIRDYIIACSWIEDCITVITDETVKFPLQSIDKDINAFLKYPSEVDPLFIIRKKTLKDMLRYGNGACAIAYKSNIPIALRVIPGYSIRITNDNPPKYKLIDIIKGGYKKTKSGTEITLSNKEVMHFQLDADSDSTMARSPMERIYDLITSDKNVSKSLAEFTSRGFFKPAFISIDGGNKKEIPEFIEFLNTMIAEGAKLFGINKKAEIKDLPHWSANEIIEIQKWIGLRVANAYKVPPFMLNLVTDTGSLNAREQRARFLENVILPLLDYEGFIYTMKLARQAFQKPEVTIDAPTMQLKLNYNTVRAAALTISKDESLLTVDEARKYYLGLDSKKETK